jgi:beta,beta-carotene 9',10'-dioxygenase
MTKPAYLKGFETLEKEFSVDQLSVTGKIPEWVNGELLRTGPAKFEAGKKSLNHWFDGHALLHKFIIRDGRVSFVSKFLTSKSYKEGIRKKTIAIPEFGTDPCYSVFGRFMSFFTNVRTDNCNVNVTIVNNQPVALTESINSWAFDSETLESKENVRYTDRLDGQMTTAHPHYDYKRKLTYNYLLKFGYKSKYQLYSLQNGSLERKLVAEIEAKKPSYIHSFGMSDNYLVMALFPLTVIPLKLKFKVRPLAENYKWEPEQKLKFYVIHKDTGEIVRYAETDPFFGFHHINTFETENGVVCDLCALPDASIIKNLYLNRLKQGNLPSAAADVVRFHIPFKETDPVTYKVVADTDFELPRINYKEFNGRKYNFAYGCSIKEKGDFLDSIVKINLSAGTHERWHKEGHYPGEPIFVAKPGSAREDEGVLLSVVLDSKKGNSYLLVLDAGNFKEIAAAALPEHIPFGFHGQFFNKS